MAGSWPSHELPYLTADSCEITSPTSRRYNCIAWVARDEFNNWWPDPWGIGYWPAEIPRVVTIDAFVQAYAKFGYKLCLGGSPETGLEKIAIFGTGPKGSEVPTHAALQLESGEWTSKLGPFEDIRHKDVEAVCGPVYGRVVCFMSRTRLTNPSEPPM
jgi:hypothetical protein